MVRAGSENQIPRRTRLGLAAAVVLLAGLAETAMGAFQDEWRPSAARRVVKVFDFEERDTNPLPVPRGWYRAQADPFGGRERDGYPIYNKAEIDYKSPARSGIGTVRLPVSGGSVSLRLAEGVIPVFREADYALSAWVRSEGLEHSRFRLAARFLDERNEPIAGSVVRTDPMLPDAGEWSLVRLRLPGEVEGAVSLQIDLEVVEPRQFQVARSGEHHVWEQDLNGTVWVDDLSVSQLPRVRVEVDAPGNVVIGPDAPVLRLTVRDLSGENLIARNVVQDDRGNVVDRSEMKLGGGRDGLPWSPKLPRFGWYRVHTDIVGEQGVVARTSTDLAFLGPQAGSRKALGQIKIGASRAPLERLGDRARFGLLLLDVPRREMKRVGELVRAAGVGALTMSIGQLPEEEADGAAVDAVASALSGLRTGGTSLSLLIPPPSSDLTQRLGVEPGDAVGAIAIGQSERTAWHEGVDGMLDRFGQMVTRWMAGESGSEAMLFSGNARASIEQAAERLRMLVPGPVVLVPWSGVMSVDAAGALVPSDHQVAVAFESGGGAQGLELFCEDWAAADEAGPMPTLRVQLVDALVESNADAATSGLGQRAVASELVRRVSLFWSVFAKEGSASDAVIELSDPWRFDPLGRDRPMPTAALAAWRSCIDRFTDRRVIADLPIADGVRCLVLAPAEGVPPERGGALVAWRDGSTTDTGSVQLFLGEGDVRTVDIFGNRSASISPVNVQTGDGYPLEVHELSLTAEPIFVEGIDTELVRFGASIQLEPRFMEATGTAVSAQLTLSNPWPALVEGALAVVEPGGRSDPNVARDPSWRISPRVSGFALRAGEETTLPITIEFSPVEDDGVRRMVMDVDLATGPNTRRVRVFTTFEIGLAGIELDARHFIDEQGGLRIDALVTNTGDETRVLDVACSVPGQPRRRASIDQLEPGATVVRRFRFPIDSLPTERGMRLTVTDPDTGARLNRTIDLE